MVDTPAARAVDLGCAYDLVVAADGASHLRVTKGAVSLEDRGVTAYVPATHEVEIPAGQHLGTPVSVTAAPELRAAVSRFDRSARADRAALADIVRLATPYDRVTLWNVIGWTRDPDAVAALEAVAPLPDPALRARVIAGDADAMDIWLDVFVDRGDQAHDRRMKNR